MKTHIAGGWVVAFQDGGHEVHEGGSVVYEDDRIVHAGAPYTGPADARVDARGKLVSPGFTNAHVHPTGPGGDYLLHDMAKNDYRTANYMAFAAPLKGKFGPPSPEATAALRTWVLLHALKNGTTTVLDVGGLRGDWDGYARIVEQVGVRVYGSPPFRDRNTFMDAKGRLYYEADAAAGTRGLEEAVGFIRKFDGAAQGRLRGMLNAAQVETCSEPLLRAAKDAARSLDVPIHTHAGGNLIELQRVFEEHGRTPVQFLADIGFLDDRTLLGHGVFTTAHPWTHYAFGDDLATLAATGATVGHCPYKYAKMAITLQSFQRYLDAGVRLSIGTDTFPMDIVAELRWASMLAKVADANYQAGQPRDVYNAATLGACTLLRRDDLGRLAPGAKADILLIDLDHMGAAFYADPIKALVDGACGRDVDTVIVDGQTLVVGRPRDTDGRGRSLRQGTRGHAPLLEPGVRLAVGRRRRRPHHPAGVPDPARVGAPSPGEAGARVGRQRAGGRAACCRAPHPALSPEGEGTGGRQTWPTQEGLATSRQRSRIERNSRAGSGPVASSAAFSFQRSGRVVPTIAVCTPGTASVNRSAAPTAASSPSRRNGKSRARRRDQYGW